MDITSIRQVTDVLDPLVATTLTGGGLVVVRTDTLYGVLASASNEAAVRKVYELKNRNAAKSCIVLISELKQLYDQPSSAQQSALTTQWPGKVSIILPAPDAPRWLQAPDGSVAYRMPDDETLRTLIAKTGPLIAPSANLEGESPARNINEAIQYFGSGVDCYVDGGLVDDDTPSQLLRISTSGLVERLR